METLQSSYLAILDGRAKFRGDATFKTFLFGVIRFTAKSIKRKAQIRGFFFQPIDRAAHIASHDQPTSITKGKSFDRALESLSSRQREIVDLVILQHFTVTEAANILGLSRGTASRHYAAAKDKLRDILDTERTCNA